MAHLAAHLCATQWIRRLAIMGWLSSSGLLLGHWCYVCWVVAVSSIKCWLWRFLLVELSLLLLLLVVVKVAAVVVVVVAGAVAVAVAEAVEMVVS